MALGAGMGLALLRCSSSRPLALDAGLHQVPGSSCVWAGTWGPQSDDVVESTTSRPLQTVGTNWEPEPRKGSQRLGPTPRSFPKSGQQRRQECGGGFLPASPLPPLSSLL